MTFTFIVCKGRDLGYAIRGHLNAILSVDDNEFDRAEDADAIDRDAIDENRGFFPFVARVFVYCAPGCPGPVEWKPETRPRKDTVKTHCTYTHTSTEQAGGYNGGNPAIDRTERNRPNLAPSSRVLGLDSWLIVSEP
ncbi:hypothetical protein ZHAS_00009651 [Anopheles sinensis]|uniref:Uncharacterized protein n=1 Tax=Anopheles sinensis TaxID=74873 RepID=A0A084VVS3_ANOSI|nr:hypothetical protein ZHAS_00009651 [Anopheles sinensis]